MRIVVRIQMSIFMRMPLFVAARAR